MAEIWREIIGYENYEVSSFGRVKNLKTNKIMEGFIQQCYHCVRLTNNKIQKCLLIHRLVCIAFNDNPDNKLCVDHKDGNKLNNNKSNLRWATYQENSQNRNKSSNNTSGVKGISYHKRDNKYQAYITVDGIRTYLGYFDNIDDAKQARCNSVRNAFGNFIHEIEK